MPLRPVLCLALLLLAGCNHDPIASDVEAVKGADAPGRKAAALRLAGLRDPRIAPVLVRALRDPDHDVRCAAAQALGQQDPADAVEPLVSLLATRGLGYECAFAPLGQLKDARAAAPLIAAATGNDSDQALATLAALGPGAMPALINGLRKEPDPHRAEAIAKALIAAGGKAVLPALLELNKEYDRTANANAVLALGLLGDAQALPALVAAADKGIGSAPLALARLGAPGIDNLVVRIGSPRPWQRDLAIAALAQARDPAIVPALGQGMKSPTPAVADASARLLAQLAGIGTPTPGMAVDAALKASALAALQRAAAGGDTRALAATLDHYLDQADGEDQLIDLMEMHGDERLAAAFIASGSERLRAAAGEWSRQTGKRPCANPPECEPVVT
ncbi:MAG: HEAT repeat domain-containing protein, partial [Arenimonas sp.]